MTEPVVVPEPASTPSPAVSEVAAVPAATPSPAPAAAEPAVTPSPAPSPAPEPAAVVTEPVPAEPAPAVVEEKPAEPGVEKPVEGAAEPVVEPVVEPAKPHEFKIPEGIKADPATMTAYSNVLGKYGISPEAGQELIDFHANTMKAATEQMAQRQQDTWAETQQTWIAEFDKSAGNKRDTILNDAKFAIADTIKDAKQRKEVWDVLAFTGAGNNKHVINALASIGKRLRERTGAVTGTLNTAKSGNPADRRYGGKPQA